VPPFLYNFGLSQEDERSEARALGLPGGRIFSVASAGDMALSLVALGAERVVAVDLDPAQLHLCRLKVAAVRQLEREEAVAFLGFTAASKSERRAWLERALRGLEPASRAFWQEHGARVLTHGAIWAGRYERFVGRLTRVVGPLFGGRVRDLVAASSLAEQADVFSRRIDGPFLRGLFRLVFHPAVFSRRGMDPQSLAHRVERLPLGEQYFRQFRTLCTATPAKDNPWLQLHTLGRVTSAAVAPTWLSEAGFTTLQGRLDRLALVQADLMDFLAREPDGAFDGFHLSNVPDWLPQGAFESLMRLIAAKAARPARLVWRYIHVDRQLPNDLQATIQIDRALGRSLSERDRFPFYSIVTATIPERA
jgi:S-adenosylmethionine-diacylglycerol 3-amino-3-carboxypropyl transferase